MPSVEYSIAALGAMIADDVRMSAYALALERTIRPGCTVLDIGTGTGVMALLACRFGAGKVVAIEPDDVIEVARQTARANGVADRIEFIQQRSTEVTLAERADVIVPISAEYCRFIPGTLLRSWMREHGYSYRVARSSRRAIPSGRALWRRPSRMPSVWTYGHAIVADSTSMSPASLSSTSFGVRESRARRGCPRNCS